MSARPLLVITVEDPSTWALLSAPTLPWQWPLLTSHCKSVLWARRGPSCLISSGFFVTLFRIFILFIVGGLWGVWSSVFLKTNLPTHFSPSGPLPHWGPAHPPEAHSTDTSCPLLVDSASSQHPAHLLAPHTPSPAPRRLLSPPSFCPPVPPLGPL